MCVLLHQCGIPLTMRKDDGQAHVRATLYFLPKYLI